MKDEETYGEIRVTCKGPYFKYVGGGRRRVFGGVIKYFRHILMSHKIF